MNPSQLSARLSWIQKPDGWFSLTVISSSDNVNSMMDLLLSKKECQALRKEWLERRGKIVNSLMMDINKNISSISLKEYAEESYLNYSMYVILDQSITSCW